MKKIIKRDGTKVPFDMFRIQNAIQLAANEAHESVDVNALSSNSLKVITKQITSGQFADGIPVEDVQNIVVQQLLNSQYHKTAEQYISYRKERDIAREQKNKYIKIGLDITSGSDKESERLNSNVPRGEVTTTLEMVKRNYSRQFSLDYILPKKYREAHESGDLYIHDLQDLIIKIPNCCLMDYPFMLDHGFQLGNKWIESPTTILTTMNVLVQMIQTQAMLQFGGLTLADIDIHLGKYVIGSYKKYLISAITDLDFGITEEEAKVRLSYCEGDIHPENEWIKKHFDVENRIAIRNTERETYKACRLLSYQINTLQVRGESSPFTTIGYGSGTSWESRLIQKSILDERWNEFDTSGVQEFPKHMFAVTAGINLNPEDPNYDLFKLANKVSAKTCYPDYYFPENQEKWTGGTACYMGCRSLLAPWYNENGEQVYLGRANTGVVTVDIPRIAIEAHSDFDKFWELFEERYNLAAEIQYWRYQRLITLTAKEASFTYIGGVFGMHLDPDETIEKVFANGRGSASLGTIGMHEACLLMTGEEIAYSQKALDFEKQMLTKVNEICDQWKEKTGVGYSNYSTPAESLTNTFCKNDLEKFGSIKGVTDKGFYVNSFHVNTEAPITAFEKIDIEAQLQKLAKGGHVGFVEVNNLSNNLPAYEKIVRYAHDQGCMYIGLNAPWDFCKTCHWTGELELSEDTNYTYKCPVCGEEHQDKIVKTVRLCGYLSTANKRPAVSGRIKEIRSRVKHN